MGKPPVPLSPNGPFSKIQQRIAQLRAQLTLQERGFNVALVASSAQSSVPKVVY